MLYDTHSCMPTLHQKLVSGPVDIIGDVHGEIDALRALLVRLGCDWERGVAQRPIVFVGDLVDRGPDSPAVVELVMKLVEQGIAQCVLGNHELNILFDLEKEGNGWFRGDASDAYQVKDEDGVVDHVFQSVLATKEQAERFRCFFATLPLVLEREDLRVVHACWYGKAVSQLPNEGDVASLGRKWAKDIHMGFKKRGLWELEKAERAEFGDLKRLDIPPTRDLPAHAEAAQDRQSLHPIKVLTSGREIRVPFEEVFFVGGKWRFVRRFDWWNHYEDEPAVVVGHYWRRRHNAWVEGKPDPWSTDKPTDWAGPRRNVFCVDYSVGRRFHERNHGKTDQFSGGLAALRWPERLLFFDDADEPVPTT